MFWKYLLYHAALWMCPPVCTPDSFAIAHQLPPPMPLTPEVLMYAPPGVPFAQTVACPPQVCAAPVQPKKTYAAKFQFKTGPMGAGGASAAGPGLPSAVMR